MECFIVVHVVSVSWSICKDNVIYTHLWQTGDAVVRCPRRWPVISKGHALVSYWLHENAAHIGCTRDTQDPVGCPVGRPPCDCLISSFLTARLQSQDDQGFCNFHLSSNSEFPAQCAGFGMVEKRKRKKEKSLPHAYVSPTFPLCVV